MIKRTLYFGNPTYLKLKNKQLSIEVLIEGENKTTEVSIEDIGIMVIEAFYKLPINNLDK